MWYRLPRVAERLRSFPNPDSPRHRPVGPYARRPSSLHPLFAPWSHRGYPALCRATDSIAHRHGGILLLHSRGPRSSSGYSVPIRHPPSVPLVGISRFHRTRHIRDVFAVQERRSDPRVIPSFHCTFLACRPLRPGSSDIDPSRTSTSTLAFAVDQRTRHSRLSRNPFHAGHGFRGYADSQLLRPVRLLTPPCTDQTVSQPTGAFISKLSTVRSPSPVAGYNYNSVWTPLLAGLAPAGTAA